MSERQSVTVWSVCDSADITQILADTITKH